MKNTLKIMLLLLALATLGSCVKEPVKRRNIAPKQNEIIYNTTNYKMSVSPIESCQDEFNIVTESEMDFFGPLMRFHFYGIPSVLLGHTIDLTKKSDIPLSFDFGNRLEWHASPDEISGAIAETNMDPQTSYPDESPFESGWMEFVEKEDGITFILRGVLKNGDAIRMELFVPLEPEQ